MDKNFISFDKIIILAKTKQKKPAKATVVNFGVSFLHLKVTEKTEKPIDDVIPKIKPIKELFSVFPKAIIMIPIVAIPMTIQTLKDIFSFKNKNVSSTSSMSTSEAYKILNLNPAQSLTKEKVNRAYIKIQKKIHPDISPETARLSSIVNEAKEIVLSDIS